LKNRPVLPKNRPVLPKNRPVLPFLFSVLPVLPVFRIRVGQWQIFGKTALFFW